MKQRAVVLASGGMDSCVTTALAAETFDPALLHVNYGQRTEAREAQAFQAIADFYRAGHRLIVTMEHLSGIGGSSLTDASMPVTSAAFHRREIPTSYVPFRNANLLAAAVSWAEVLGAQAVFVGAVEEDSSGYPDCRKVFYDAYAAVIEAGTKPETHISIITPLIDMSKEEIVLQGLARGAPFHLTWSCYQSSDVACGVCDSCALRLRGFQRAGVDDPIPYRTRPDYAHIRT
jgi:7-cyano-7-deazaguanine synthase